MKNPSEQVARWYDVGRSELDTSMGLERTEQVPAAAPVGGAAGSLGRKLLRQRMFPEHSEVSRIGRYMILRFVGAGGMGEVFAAYDATLDRKVAIKLLPAELGGKLERRTRLLREAQALAKLSHANVVQVYEVGEHEGQVYVVMEYVEGQTLDAWVVGEGGERPSAREILAMYVQAGRGLAAAHRAGLVHRDFKPSNVLVDADGRARVLDFGLVVGSLDKHEQGELLEERAASDSFRALDVELTTTGTMLGTPAYMAPEQFAGQIVDARADQFGFCVALHEALTGVRPFTGRTVAELMQNVAEGVRVRRLGARAMSRRVSRALDRGLAVKPALRWASMEALLDALQPPSRRKVWAVASLVALPLAGLGTWWLTANYEQQLEAHEDQIVSEQRARAELELEGARAHNRRLLSLAIQTRDNPELALQLLREVDLELEPEPSRWIQTGSERIEAAMIPEQVLTPDSSRIERLRYSPGGRWLAASGRKGVALWSLEGPEARALELDGAEDMSAIAFNPAVSGQVALLGKGRIELRSLLDPAQPGLRIEADGLLLARPEFSGDGRWLVVTSSASRSVPLRVWSVETGEALELDTGRHELGAVSALSPTGARLAGVLDDRVVGVWELGGGGRRFLDGPRGDLAVALAFDPTGQRLAIGYMSPGAERTSVRVWSLDAPDREPLVLEGHGDRITDLAFSPDGRQLVSGSRDRTARVWTFEGPAGEPPIAASSRVLHGHEGTVSGLAFSPDGETIVSSSEGTIRLWPSDGSEVPFALSGRRPCLSPDGSRLALVEGSRVLIHALDGAPERPPLARHLDSGPFYNSNFGERAAIDAKGRWLASIPGHGRMYLWSTQDWRLTATYQVPEDLHDLVLAVAVDGSVVAGTEAGELLLWREGEDEAVELGRQSGQVVGVAFDPAGARLISTGRNGEATLWTLAEPGQGRGLAEHEGYVHALAFSDDGRAFGSASVKGELRVWPSLDQSLDSPVVLAGHEDEVNALSFDAAGVRLLSASDDDTARLWSVEDGRELAVFRHESSVEAARFSPDGRSLATASGDGVRLWRAEEGEAKLLALLTHDDEVLDLDFAPGGTTILTGTSDSSAHMWSLADLGAPSSVAFEGNASMWRYENHAWGKKNMRGPADLSRVRFVAGGTQALVLTEDSAWIWDADYSTEERLTWMWRSFPSCPSSTVREHGLGLDIDEAKAATARCEEMLVCTARSSYGECKHLLIEE
jgi:WD40 repeat protein/serine/threonine protein kinase